MRIRVVIVVLSGLLLLNFSTTNAQDSTLVIKFNQKDIGIPITKTGFDSKVSNYLKLMSDWTVFKTNDYIDMVRVYNTIGGDLPMKNNSIYTMYYTVFLVMYSKPAAKHLDAKLSKGMAMYSAKYKIWIGDVPLGNDKSRFRVDTLR